MRARRVSQSSSPFSVSCIICFILLLPLTPLDLRSACSAHKLQQQPAPCPAARHEQADDCAALLFLVGKHSIRRFPSTLTDMDAYCRSVILVSAWHMRANADLLLQGVGERKRKEL